MQCECKMLLRYQSYKYLLGAYEKVTKYDKKNILL